MAGGAGGGKAWLGQEQGAQGSRQRAPGVFHPHKEAGSPNSLWGGGPQPSKSGRVVSWLKTTYVVALYPLLTRTPIMGCCCSWVGPWDR